MSRLIYWIVLAFESGICVLPINAVVRIGRFLGLLVWMILPHYRAVAFRNVTIAFPDLSAAERRRLVRQHFQTLGGNLLAGPRLARLTKEQLLEVVEIEGLEVMRSTALEGRGCVFTVSHLGNWEILALISPFVMGRPCGTVYQRLNNPLVDAHVRKTRGRFGLALFERKEGFGKAMELLRVNGGLGVLIDQHAGDAGVWCPLFNRLASTSPLAATLALRTGSVILPIVVYTNGIGRWKCVISPPLQPTSSDISVQTAELNLSLEAQIRRQPADWFWVHNRWKTPQPKFLLASYKRGVTTAPGQRLENLQRFRILIRSSNWLGDAVMNLPAVRRIKAGRPDAHVTVLCPSKLEAVWKQVAEVDEVIGFPAQDGLSHLIETSRMIREGNFEVAVVFPNSIKTALEAWLGRVPRRVGFPGHAPRTLLLNQVLRPGKKKKKAPAAPCHQLYHYLQMAEFIGADVDGVTEANCFESRAPTVGKTKRTILVCPGAEYGPAKQWLPERYAEVMRAAGAARKIHWLLVGTAKDRPVAEMIRGLAGLSEPQNLAGKTTLEQLITYVREADLLLTNDTGTMHLATMLGTPTVSIFGSTEPLLTGPLGRGHKILRHPVDCSPCFLRECPIDFRCMKGVEVDQVTAAVLELCPE